MNTSLYKNWWALTIKGVLAIIFGLMIFFAPGMGAVALAYYFGFLVIFTGFFMIFAAFAHKSVNQNWGWWLFEGILDIILGVIVISYPLMSIAIFILFVGVWAIFMGISQVISGRQWVLSMCKKEKFVTSNFSIGRRTPFFCKAYKIFKKSYWGPVRSVRIPVRLSPISPIRLKHFACNSLW